MDPLSIAAVGWLMSSLVNKAVTALLEAWAKQIDLGDEFKTLKDRLLELGALLLTCTNKSFPEKLVEDLQQLAYRAENFLDELDYYRLKDQIQQTVTQEKVNSNSKSLVASSSSGFQLASNPIISLEGIHFRSGPYTPVPLSETFPSKINLSQRMNKLVEQLQKYVKEVRYAVETESLVITAQNTKISQTGATNLQQTSPFLTEPRVFGRDQERDQLINLLTNKKSAIFGDVPVIAIVGSGGVGKTTLAQLVFNDPKVHSYFEVRLWICVSTRFDMYRLTREMLQGASGKRYSKFCNFHELQTKLNSELLSKRFLLVLDDMWEDKDKRQWDSMVAPLNYGIQKGSIILVTTRNQSVAKMVDARDNIYLQGVDEDAFLSFFSTCIFDDPNYGRHWKLSNIGQQIANKLKGNPLAAKIVSALLKEKLDVRYWIEIRDSKEWKSQSDPNDIMPALRLNYEHMPFHLQRCFSYCAMFPKDHTFTCEELVYLWMAQGFLDVRSEGKRMEDIGNAYFNDLFNRGFFQTKQSTDGLLYYTFHNLTHDLARMISFKECLTINGDKPIQIPPTIRHLLIFECGNMGEEAIVRHLALKGKNLRTIICLDELPSVIFQPIWSKKTPFVRAMRMTIRSEIHLQRLPFRDFVSLRYLRIFIRFYNTLPGEICRLYHLEVFQVDADKWVFNKLPRKFSDLVSLRHFIVDGYYRLHSKIRGVGKLTSLQELKYFDVQQQQGFEIEQLGSLKEIGGALEISNLEIVKSKIEASKARLAEKEKLDALHLQWNHGKQEDENVLEGLKPNTNLKLLHIDGYGGVTSPTWLAPSLFFLESLTLMNCKAWELLPPIGELEFLKHLMLFGLAVREIGPQCYGTRQSLIFPSLEELGIINMPDLKKWVWSDQLQLFPCLKKIRIERCTKLVDHPLSRCATSKVLERFPSLESLYIRNCPLIFQLPPLTLDKFSSCKVAELLAFHELSSLRVLEISNISSLESLDLHNFGALENLVIRGCESLASLTFGEHSVCLKNLTIRSCKILSSMKGLKSWVNLQKLYFHGCPGFIAAWDSVSKDIDRAEPDFSLSLTEIQGDSLTLLTLPICKQLTSLVVFQLEFSAFTEEYEVSLQFLTSLNLVNIRGYKNLQSFPFDLFPSLKVLRISFPHIRSLPKNICTEITKGCLKLRNIKEVYIRESPLQLFPSLKIEFILRSEEMICQQMDSVN